MNKFKHLSIVAALAALLLTGCAEDGSDPNTGAQNSENLTTKISADLQAVSEEMVPESLDDGGALEADGISQKNVLKKAEDICGELDLFRCQPKLLRFYAVYTKFNIVLTRILVVATGIALGQLEDGAEGTITEADGDVIEFRKTSNTNFEVLVSTTDGPALHISVADNVYNLKVDFTNAKDRDEDAPDRIENTIVFNSRTDWTVESTAIGVPCDPVSPAAPNRVRMHLRRQGNFWKGKVMAFSPNAFADESVLTCENREEPLHQAPGLLMTDLAADTVSVKGALYATDTDPSIEVENIDEFNLNEVCDNFPGLDLCQAPSAELQAFFDNFPNPFCMRSLVLSPTVHYGNNCLDFSPGLAIEPFGPETDWVKPADFAVSDITLPTEL